MAKTEPGQLAPYVAAGLCLIPLHRWDAVDEHRGRTRQRGKSPIDGNWTKRQYRNDDAPAHMAGGMNVGVRLKADDLVVDVDPRNFPVTDAGVHETLGTDNPFRRLCRDVGLDADAFPTVLTGSGGLHLYMRKPSDVSPRTRCTARPRPSGDPRRPHRVRRRGRLHQGHHPRVECDPQPAQVRQVEGGHDRRGGVGVRPRGPPPHDRHPADGHRRGGADEEAGRDLTPVRVRLRAAPPVDLCSARPVGRLDRGRPSLAHVTVDLAGAVARRHRQRHPRLLSVDGHVRPSGRAPTPGSLSAILSRSRPSADPPRSPVMTTFCFVVSHPARG